MPAKKRLEIISLGDELLNGIRHNTHLPYIGKELARRGIMVQRDQEIRDSQAEISQYFLETWARTDVLITTGGLGPTEDDVTRETIANALGRKLVHSQEAEDAIIARFKQINRTPTANNLRQAELIDGASLLPNPYGTAPGQWLEINDKILILLPGPTHEMRPMFMEQVLPRLEKLNITIANDAYLQLRTCGIGENLLATKLEPIIEEYGKDLNVAYTAENGIIDVRLGSASDALPWKELEKIGDQCQDVLGEDFVGYGDCNMAEMILYQLRLLDKTLAVAESCTGGAIASAFTAIPGASKVFSGGIVCYNNDIKVGVLGVPEPIIQQHGAVSPECAVAMASAAAERFDADYAISITGFAGPAGGMSDVPIGTIFMGYSTLIGDWSRKEYIQGTRNTIRNRAVILALDWVRRKLKKYEMHDFIESMALRG